MAGSSTSLRRQGAHNPSTIFLEAGVSVGVGLTKDGVAIRSQDTRVDAENTGILSPYADDASVHPVKLEEYPFLSGEYVHMTLSRYKPLEVS